MDSLEVSARLISKFFRLTLLLMSCSPTRSQGRPTIYNQGRWVHVSDSLSLHSTAATYILFCRYCHLLGWNEKISICNWWKGKSSLGTLLFYLPIYFSLLADPLHPMLYKCKSRYLYPLEAPALPGMLFVISHCVISLCQ